MTRSSLAVLAAVVLASANAYAQSAPPPRGAMLPPPQYDKFFPGDLTVKRLLTQKDEWNKNSQELKKFKANAEKVRHHEIHNRTRTRA
jgi:hypothetical protein